MARNIKKEMEWRKKKYTRIILDVDKTLGETFKERIKQDKNYTSITSWGIEQIKKYLEKN